MAVRHGCVRRRGDGTCFGDEWNARVGGSGMHLQPNRMSLHDDSCAVEQCARMERAGVHLFGGVETGDDGQH